MRILLAFLLLSLCASAQARLYMWVNPATGSVEMSRTPPGWYRALRAGPRIQVYENGNIVDDTSIRVSPKQSTELRTVAFQEFEVRKQAEAIKKLERAARRERLKQEEAELEQGAEIPADGETQGESAGETALDELPENLDQAAIDGLKSLIQAWGTVNSNLEPQ